MAASTAYAPGKRRQSYGGSGIIMSPLLTTVQRPEPSRILTIYSLLACLSLVVFGCLHIVGENNARVGLSELIGALAVMLVALASYRGVRPLVARTCFLLVIGALLLMMLITGGTQGTGILWFFMFPVMAFFLSGSLEGVYWMLMLIGMVLCAWLIHNAGQLPLYYDGIELRQLVITLCVVAVGIYVYQQFRERATDQAHDSYDQLQANLHQMAELHHDMEMAKSEFVTLASHQLRTPISAIAWSSELLLSGDTGKLTDDQRESVQSIEDSNNRLAAIVNNMLLISNLELNKLEVKREPADLTNLIHRTLLAEQKKLPDRTWHITEEYDKAMPPLMIDPKLMTVLVRNLISNALKYTPDNGNITLKVSHSDAKVMPGSAGSILFEVIDTGYGIPHDQYNMIFAKLTRGSNIKARDTDGTGLGLYTVKALLDQVGGTISFTSQENKGTHFSILLPLEGMKEQESHHA